ncbi:alkaline phosphatase D family protein [Streptomyces lycii]|uniref:Alkaline phosphatase family protein n=1 Tax=Streptomyces lycii TaxID=2654337 RepID=A0ABQ7FB77_9ACTN|nr:alkaline phosphatase D family protein [Streptomyces lycii]KAF4405515.1 alkaline phosphatase family protein [Streptomyces lycii]
MAGLRLGPLLRYTDEHSATVWVETDGPCEAEVRCADGAGGSARSWLIAGHHYALVTVTGLSPGSSTPYRVLLDGREVWPPPGGAAPPGVIRTLPAPGDDTPVRVSFGSCRWSAPPAAGAGSRLGPDALDTLSSRMAADPGTERPDVLLLLGDQVYADETSAATRRWLAARRDLGEPPGDQVADYEEYTRLYDESWSDPELRQLLATVPSCMIFDDHDVIDDWNTSAAWLAEMEATGWWRERLLSGLMSYWVYQHLGNLSPAELAADPLFTAVAGADDGTALLREFAAAAADDPDHTRWSYRRDFGRTRLLMVDTRAARVLPERQRAMLGKGTADWLREQALDDPGGRDHLLIGTSLPWLLPPAVHAAEQWDAALCAGERGARWSRLGERLRQAADLEHWAAFPESFDALTDLVARAGGGPEAPATVCVLSGDVHHAYVAEPRWTPARQPAAGVFQLTCSPLHNSVPASIKLGFRFGWSGPGRLLGRVLARHGRVRRPAIGWDRTGGPWFGNQLMTLTLRGRTARLKLYGTRRDADGEARLTTVLDRALTRD